MITPNYRIGTLVRNIHSGSMAIVIKEVPQVDVIASLPFLLQKDHQFTKEELAYAEVRKYTIKEEMGDNWDDQVLLLKRLTGEVGIEIPYHHSRVHLDWKIVAG